MERYPGDASLTNQEWQLVTENMMPAARANAERGSLGAHMTEAGDQWIFWSGVDAEGAEGLNAVCTDADGGVTSYALYPDDQTVRRIHISADVPDIQMTFTTIEGVQELGSNHLRDVTDLYTTPTEPGESSTMSDLEESVNTQQEFGLDIPMGDELRPLQDVMAELLATYGDVMIRPAQAA